MWKKAENGTKRIDVIYLIKNNVTLRCRIGSAKDIKKRWSNYLANLRAGNGNKLMQKDFNDWGEQAFDFIILEECNVKDLLSREKYWLEQYSDVAMYNSNKIHKTKKSYRTGKKAKDYKEKRSQITSGENNGNNTKLSVEDVKEIKMLLKKGCSIKELADQYCVSKTLIYNIKANKRWSSVEIEEVQ